jgi:hypothetical protein
MSFSFAGSMTGGSPVVRRMQVGETCYAGQLVMHSHATANCTGYCWLADVAATANEDDMGILGIVSGVHTTNDAGWNATYHGDTATSVTTQAQVVANSPIGQTEIEMTVIVPNDTLINGPLYNATYGTAITELVCTAISAAGTTATHAGITGIDYSDDYGVMYCRSGANRGHYRTMITPGTAAQVSHVPFPYDMAIGDIYVSGPGVPGITGLQLDADANFIDAGDTLAIFFDVWLHIQNLEETGQENYTFTFLDGPCGFKGWQALND